MYWRAGYLSLCMSWMTVFFLFLFPIQQILYHYINFQTLKETLTTSCRRLNGDVNAGGRERSQRGGVLPAVEALRISEWEAIYRSRAGKTWPPVDSANYLILLEPLSRPEEDRCAGGNGTETLENDPYKQTTIVKSLRWGFPFLWYCKTSGGPSEVCPLRGHRVLFYILRGFSLKVHRECIWVGRLTLVECVGSGDRESWHVLCD